MRRRLLVLAATVSLVVTVGVPSVSSAGPPKDDGSQPLPGYTVLNPPLEPITVGGVPTTVHQGIFEHAAFDIEVPPNWNGELAMYAHGYRGQGTVLTVDPPPFGLRQRLANQGYAWAASSYYDNGYDVQAGVLSTHDLADHFEELVGPTKQVYLIGVSMGGHVTGRSIEDYPHFYAGALPMCGVLGDNELFDFFLDENIVAQDLAGVPAFPPPADYLANDVPDIEAALGLTGIRPGGSPTNALGLQYRSIVINRSGGLRPGAENAFSFWYSIHFPFTLWAPDTGGTLAQNPGRLATNVGTDYEPNTPVDVNDSVVRVPAADRVDRVRANLTQSPQIKGTPVIPVLSLHDLGDLFVPFSMEEIYGAEVAHHGRSTLLVQRAIRAANHCEFSNTEAGRAWDDLTTWVHTGVRPAGDDVTNPAEVAQPTFGCAFTDPTVHTGTRPLYAACPT
jgi:pimeloyl-ACP methyl ester carboxylesterase